MATTSTEDERSLREDREAPRDQGLWRDLVAYWILGLCNNYGYVVMLTAAHDILKELGGGDHGDDGKSMMMLVSVLICVKVARFARSMLCLLRRQLIKTTGEQRSSR